jgi:hypothetical protein
MGVDDSAISYLLSEYASRNSDMAEYGRMLLSDGTLSPFYVLRVRPSVTTQKTRTRKPKV